MFLSKIFGIVYFESIVGHSHSFGNAHVPALRGPRIGINVAHKFRPVVSWPHKPRKAFWESEGGKTLSISSRSRHSHWDDDVFCVVRRHLPSYVCTFLSLAIREMRDKILRYR